LAISSQLSASPQFFPLFLPIAGFVRFLLGGVTDTRALHVAFFEDFLHFAPDGFFCILSFFRPPRFFSPIFDFGLFPTTLDLAFYFF